MGASGNGRKWEWEQAGNGRQAGAGALEDGDVVLRAVVRRGGDRDDRPLVGQVHSAAQARHTGERANKQTIRQTNKQTNDSANEQVGRQMTNRTGDQTNKQTRTCAKRRAMKPAIGRQTTKRAPTKHSYSARQASTEPTNPTGKGSSKRANKQTNQPTPGGSPRPEAASGGHKRRYRTLSLRGHALGSSPLQRRRTAGGLASKIRRKPPA